MLTIAPAIAAMAFATGPEQPHIVFFLVDDLGWNGVGYHNRALETPHIDKLAMDGIRLESYYSYKVCAPARASFLTGRFPYKLAAVKVGVRPHRLALPAHAPLTALYLPRSPHQTNFAYFWTLEGTNASYTMFPRRLQDAGYKTHMVGKVRPSRGHAVRHHARIPPHRTPLKLSSTFRTLASGTKAFTPQSICPRTVALILTTAFFPAVKIT